MGRCWVLHPLPPPVCRAKAQPCRRASWRSCSYDSGCRKEGNHRLVFGEGLRRRRRRRRVTWCAVISPPVGFWARPHGSSVPKGALGTSLALAQAGLGGWLGVAKGPEAKISQRGRALAFPLGKPSVPRLASPNNWQNFRPPPSSPPPPQLGYFRGGRKQRFPPPSFFPSSSSSSSLSEPRTFPRSWE